MTLQEAIEKKLGRPLTEADKSKLERHRMTLPDPQMAFADGISLNPKRPDLYVWRLSLPDDE